MKYGLDVSTAGSYADPRVLADLAAEAEEAGWDGFFIWDALFFGNRFDIPLIDPWVALAAIASKTRRIRLGAMVTPLARRRPWQVARAAVSLDHLSNGRLIVGAGLGYHALDFEAFGEEADPKIRAEKLDEGLQIMSGLWTGEPFSFQGKHYRVNHAQFLPKPIQTPRIPIWVAGYWPHKRPFRRAACWDGIYPGRVDEEPMTLDVFREIVAYVKAQHPAAVPFDFPAGGQTPSDPTQAAEIVQPFEAAGATWWIEGIEDLRGSFEEIRARVRSGPPKIEEERLCK